MKGVAMAYSSACFVRSEEAMSLGGSKCFEPGRLLEMAA